MLFHFYFFIFTFYIRQKHNFSTTLNALNASEHPKKICLNKLNYQYLGQNNSSSNLGLNQNEPHLPYNKNNSNVNESVTPMQHNTNFRRFSNIEKNYFKNLIIPNEPSNIQSTVCNNYNNKSNNYRYLGKQDENNARRFISVRSNFKSTYMKQKESYNNNINNIEAHLQLKSKQTSDAENNNNNNKSKSKRKFFKASYKDYSICCDRKNDLYARLQNIIRHELSVENILRVVNSHDIVQRLLIEKSVIDLEMNKPNFFDKLKSSNCVSFYNT